jgi:Uncharacterized protein conserved in bacteria (DUF2330)
MRVALVSLIAVFVIVAPAPRARACVALLQQQGGVVEQHGQVSILSVHDDVTDQVFVIDVPAAGNDFGLLIPVPEQPTIDTTPVSTDAIDALELATRPSFSTGEVSDEGGGCGCASALAGDFDNRKGVVEGEAVDIGPVTAQWVSGAQGNAIVDWLDENGFTLPAGAEAVIDGYANTGMSFVAFKRNETSTGAARVGVRFTLSGDRRAYALGMSKVGSSSSMAFTIFVATDSDAAVAPDAPYAELGAADLGDGGIIADGDYRGAVAAAVAEADNAAFVIETFGPAADLPADAAALFASGAFVTRVSTVVDPSALTSDVTFTSTASTTPQSFAALSLPDLRPWQPRLDLSLSLLLLALLLRLGVRALKSRATSPARA